MNVQLRAYTTGVVLIKCRRCTTAHFSSRRPYWS
ncbi:MAG: hypothetical protein H0V86_02705 [Chloroflexia bacterium]|nr:hypothetical protein [Chloroflexia bacterium]